MKSSWKPQGALITFSSFKKSPFYVGYSFVAWNRRFCLPVLRRHNENDTTIDFPLQLAAYDNFLILFLYNKHNGCYYIL